MTLCESAIAQYTYATNGETLTIIRYNSQSGGSVTIPNSVNGLPVVSIASAAFSSATVSGVTIPASITNIDSFAFDGCLSLSTVSIGSGVTSIGNQVFESCHRLASFFVDAANTTFSSSNGILYSKDLTALLVVPALTSGNFTIASTVTSLGNYAFEDSLVTNVIFPATTTNIGTAPFLDCTNLYNISVASNNLQYVTISGVLFNKNQTLLLSYPSKLTGAYSIPNTVTSVMDYAFLENFQIPSLFIPASVSQLGIEPFSNCTNLSTITVDASNAFFSSVDGILFDKTQTQLVVYPGGKKGDYIVPNGVITLGLNAFSGCAGISQVTIPDGVKLISSNAFFSCPNLGNVTIGNGVTNISTFAFFGCGSLTNLTIGSGVTSIGLEAFAACFNLKGVYFLGNAPLATTPFTPFSIVVYYLPGTTGWSSTYNNLSAVLWNPQIQTAAATFGISSSGFGFTAIGPANSRAVVSATADLAHANWIPQATNTFTNGSFYFRDAYVSNFSARFYRLSPP